MTQSGPDTPTDVWSLELYDYAVTATQAGTAPWRNEFFNPPPLRYFDFSVAPARETQANAAPTPLDGAVSQTLAPAIFLDGQSGMLLAQNQAPILGAQYTISAWAALSAFPPFSTASTLFSTLGKGAGGASGGALLQVIDQNQWFARSNGAYSQNTFPFPLGLNDWHNYALTCDGTTATVYLDGTAIGTFPSGGAGPQQNPFWSLGYDRVGGPRENWLNGYVQWFSAWSRCLSADEVAFQQYGSVSDDQGILVDAAMDVAPATDLASAIQILLAGSAAFAEQRVTVTNWSPPPQQLNPPASPGNKRVTGSVRWHTPVLPDPGGQTLDDSFEDSLWLARQNFRDLSKPIADHRYAQFAAASRDAYREAVGKPAPAFWRRDGGDAVFVVRHPTDGEVETLRVDAAAISACQMWWMSFMFTLLSGIASLFFISFRAQDLTDWIQRRILNNQTVMEALAAAWGTNPDFTGFVVVKLLVVLNGFGLLKSFLWFVAYQASYWALAKIITYLVVSVFSGGAATALFAVRAGTTAVQLGLLYFGGPNQPSYKSSCG